MIFDISCDAYQPKSYKFQVAMTVGTQLTNEFWCFVLFKRRSHDERRCVLQLHGRDIVQMEKWDARSKLQTLQCRRRCCCWWSMYEVVIVADSLLLYIVSSHFRFRFAPHIDRRRLRCLRFEWLRSVLSCCCSHRNREFRINTTLCCDLIVSYFFGLKVSTTWRYEKVNFIFAILLRFVVPCDCILCCDFVFDFSRWFWFVLFVFVDFCLFVRCRCLRIGWFDRQQRLE